MPFERIRDLADKSTRSLRCGIPVAGVVLIALVFGAPFASAAPLGEAAGPAGSVATSVTGVSVPSLPSAPAPATPPAPVATPTVPQVPANQTPVKVPTGVTPTSPSSHPAPTPSGSATKVSDPERANLPSIGGTTNAANESVGRVTSTSTETAQRVAASVRNDAGAGWDSPTGPGPRAPTSEVGVAQSVEAVLPRWFAYVWPAIALGQTGKVLAVLLARWEGATSLPASDAARSLFQLGGVTGNIGVSALSERSGTPDSPLAAPSVGPVPGGSGMSFFLTMVTSLLALVALMALAKLAVGEDFFSFSRWHE